MKFNDKDAIILSTRLWKGERFEDGRPKVPDEWLERVAKMTTEEMWEPLYQRGYRNQFVGGLKTTNKNRPVMVGRALTACYMPKRPDFFYFEEDYGHEVLGHIGYPNQWPLEQLQEHDVVVYDLNGVTREHCPIGGNLSNLIKNRTKDGGLVLWGGLRDLQQIEQIEETQTYYVDSNPTTFGDNMLTSINTPCRIDTAVVLPGDVVLATSAGVLFIPPHLVETCLIEAEKAHAKDDWGFEMIKTGRYTAADVDTPWKLQMWEDFYVWFHTAPEAQPYSHLNFDQELEDARNNIKIDFWGKVRKLEMETEKNRG